MKYPETLATGRLALNVEKKRISIGIVSDTHGLLRDSVKHELSGVDLIVHAGDFDTPDVLAEIREIAPVLCARGNMDAGEWCYDLPEYDMAEIAGQTLCVIHDVYRLDLDPSAANIAVVVSGHTHQPLIAKQRDVVYLNPGSAGYQRMGKPVTMAKLTLTDERLTPEIIDLK
jgi:putative phosphoesterase